MAEPVSMQTDETPVATPATPAPAPTPAPTPTPTPAPTPTPTDATSGGTQVAPTPPPSPSWLSSLREKGIDLGNDETAAMARLAELHGNYSKLAPLAPYVQQYIQHAPAFSKFLADQQKQTQAPQSQDPNAPFYAKYWNPPEFNPAWERMLTTDANGNIVAVAGAPPDVVPKYLAYQQFRKEQAEKFLSNPHEYLKDTISHLAREEAQKIVKEQFGQVETKQTVGAFMQENENWLYDRDANGRVAMQNQFNPHTGQYVQVPKLSQWGSAFADYVREEAEYQAQHGIPQDINRQRDYAMAKLQRDYAIWKMNNPQSGATGTPTAPAPQTPIDPQQAANQRFLQQNNPAAAIPPAGGNSNPAPPGPVTRSNLTEMLRQEFKAKGITDEALVNSN